jgi:hypothetical protein
MHCEESPGGDFRGSIDLPHLRTYGWALVPGVVDPPQIAAALAALRDAGGVDLDDPATWAIEHMSPPVWAHQAQWDLRQDPRVHAAFAAAHGREDLIVTQEAVPLGPREPRAALAARVGGVQPGPPAALTPLGRRLVGLDPWLAA